MTTPSETRSGNLGQAHQRLLNCYIYDYLLKQQYSDTARIFQKEVEVPTLTEDVAKQQAASEIDEGTLGASLDFLDKSRKAVESQQTNCDRQEDSSPAGSPELRQADIPIDVPGGFLCEWWSIFWDMSAARSGRGGSSSANTFLAQNQRLKQDQQNRAASASLGQQTPGVMNNSGQVMNAQSGYNAMMMRNAVPNGIQQISAGSDPNGNPADIVLAANGQMNQKTREALMRQAMMNNGQRKSAYPPTPAQIQHLKTQQFLQQQQMHREESNDMSGAPQHPQSPALQAPSPSKRQRLSPDGAYAAVQQGSRGPQMQGPGGPQAHQAQQMLLQAGINPAGLSPQQLMAFQSQTPVMQQKQLAAYVQGLATQQQRAMAAASKGQTNLGNAMINASPVMQNNESVPQPGNHALQDYQMQLMLLEQQNKKRLLMARQEQERLQAPQGDNGQAFSTSSPQGSRMQSSPQPIPRDVTRSTPKMGNQPVPGSPQDSNQHVGGIVNQGPQRNSSPNMANFGNVHAASQDPQQQMMYYKQMQNINEGGIAGQLMMGPGGQVIRPPMGGQGHPSHQANQQQMMNMMAGQDQGMNASMMPPNPPRNAQQHMLWQQQQMMQQMQNGHRMPQGMQQNLTPQQQHALHQQHMQQVNSGTGAPQVGGPHNQGSGHLQHQQQMLPPSAPGPAPGQPIGRGQPPSPSLSNNQPPTPVQQHAKAPSRKASKQEQKKAAAKSKKNGQPATPTIHNAEPPTPTTPITPHASFNGQNNQSQGQQTNQTPNSAVGGQAQSISAATALQSGDANVTFGAIDNSDPSSFLNEFAGGGVDMDLSMMQDFDFDSFLQNSDSGPSGSLGAFPVFESDDNVDVGGE